MKPSLQRAGGIPLFRTSLEQLDKILENVRKDKPALAGKQAGCLSCSKRGAEAPLAAGAGADPELPTLLAGVPSPAEGTRLCREPCPGYGIVAQPGPPLRK